MACQLVRNDADWDTVCVALDWWIGSGMGWDVRSEIKLADWSWIDIGLGLHWHRIDWLWHYIGLTVSWSVGSSSVETLQSDRIEHLFPYRPRDCSPIDV